MNKYGTLQAPIAQVGAAATAIIAGRAGLRIYVVTIVFSLEAPGTAKFSDSGGDLSGAMTLAQGGGMAEFSDEDRPVLATNVAGSDLTLTTTGGGADGWVRYYFDL